jgi:DNA adenine methylase
MRPFLKWAGGKRQLLPVIREFLVNELVLENSTYYEPFVGGGSVFFDVANNNSVINDYNQEIINAYEVIRDFPEELIAYLKIHEHNHGHDYFYQIRNLDRIPEFDDMTNIEMAARTIYLNKTCFNGLYRVNRKGYFNTPIGRYVKPMICDENNIREISTFLNNHNIRMLHGDFENAVPNPQAGDFVYFDPPYDYEDQKGFVGYSAQGFTRNDLTRLKHFCDQLIEQGCIVLISNNDTKFVRDTFNDENYQIIYEINQYPANRNISSNGANRSTKVPEVLIYGKNRE